MQLITHRRLCRREMGIADFKPIEDPRQHSAIPLICSRLAPSTLCMLLIAPHDIADTKREVLILTLLKVTAMLPALSTQVRFL